MLNPPLTRRASALLSRAPSPRTPSTRSPVQQPLHISSTDNRKSSDSWNSSNYDPADDPDLEWKPEHVLLLTRVCSPIIYSSTTYHIHPIFRPSMLFLRMYSPPLLAPFPLQTCSIKLPVVFLRPKVQVIGLTHFVRPGPNSSSFAVSVLRKSRPSKNYITPSKRRTWTRISNSFVRSSNAPLTLGAPSTAKTVWISCSLPSSIYAARTRFPGTSLFHVFFTRFDFFANFLRHRTSHRLRNSDHLFPNPAYHTRPSSIDSQTLNVSTPSSTTLISCGTAETQWKAQPSRSSIRRSVSSMSSTSSSSLRSLPLAPVRRTDSFGEARKPMKRVPSFSVAAKDSDVSSDEEENLRTKQTKKARRGTDHRVNKLLSSQDESPVRRPRMNLQRNPSILGPELPHNPPSAYPQPAAAHLLEQIPAMGAHPPPPTQSPRTPCTQRTLRRMRPLPTRAARRISFSSLGENDLVSEPVDIIPSEDPGNGLGSAFQLR